MAVAIGRSFPALRSYRDGEDDDDSDAEEENSRARSRRRSTGDIEPRPSFAIGSPPWRVQRDKRARPQSLGPTESGGASDDFLAAVSQDKRAAVPAVTNLPVAVGGREESTARQRDTGNTDVPNDLRAALRISQPFYATLPTDVASEKSSALSAASSNRWPVERSMRQFPPSRPWEEVVPVPGYLRGSSFQQKRTDFRQRVLPVNSHAEAARQRGSQRVKSEHIPTLWSDLYDQRQKINRCRRNMAGLREKIRVVREKQRVADNALQKWNRSYSRSGRMLPRKRLAKLLDEIQSLQSDYTSMESEYETLEKELDQREARLEASEIDFFREFSNIQVVQPPTDMPPERFGASAPRDAYNPKEEDQDRPDPVGIVVPPGVGRVGKQIRDTGAGPTDSFLLGISGDRPIDIHPLYRSLLSAVADLKLAQEGYKELVVERQAIISDLQARFFLAKRREGKQTLDEHESKSLDRSLSGKDLSQEFKSVFASYLDEGDMGFLEDFGDMEEAAQTEINHCTEQVVRIRAECIGAGVIPKNISSQEKLAVFGEDDEGPADTSAENAIMANFSLDHSLAARPLAHSNFPILLSNPRHLLARRPLTAKSALKKTLELPEDDPRREALVEDCVKEYGILTMLTRSSPENKSDFINRWLLQQLRMSPLEVVQLFTIFTSVLGVVNLTRWQEDVLYFWARDDSNQPGGVSRGSITRDYLPGTETVTDDTSERLQNKIAIRSATAGERFVQVDADPKTVGLQHIIGIVNG